MESSNLYAVKGDHAAAWQTSKEIMDVKPHILETALEDIADLSYKPTSYEVERKRQIRF
jgi:hypothetical protein